MRVSRMKNLVLLVCLMVVCCVSVQGRQGFTRTLTRV